MAGSDEDKVTVLVSKAGRAKACLAVLEMTWGSKGCPRWWGSARKTKFLCLTSPVGQHSACKMDRVVDPQPVMVSV